MIAAIAGCKVLLAIRRLRRASSPVIIDVPSTTERIAFSAGRAVRAVRQRMAEIRKQAEAGATA